MATASPLARARRSTELSLVVMAGMITAIAYTFASLGQYTQIPARIIPFLLTLLGLLLLAHLAVLLSCDLIVLAHLDAHGRTLAEVCHPSTGHATAWTRCAPRACRSSAAS